MAASKGYTIAKVNYPIYSINVITERHILVAGGGGGSKTGIPNKIEIFELVPGKMGESCRGQLVASYDAGLCAIMNSFFYVIRGKCLFLATDRDNCCQLYRLSYCLQDCSKLINNKSSPAPEPISTSGVTPNVKKRRSAKSVRKEPVVSAKEAGDAPPISQPESKPEPKLKSNGNDVNGNLLQVSFRIQPDQDFQTDFDDKDVSIQKVVTFATKKEILFTAGSDGHIREWKAPEYRQLLDIAAHQKEIDDLAIDHSEESIVSVSRDSHAYVHDVTSGRKVCELINTRLPASCATEKFYYRRCKFGLAEGDKRNECLYTVANPVIRKKPPTPSVLTKWSRNGWSPMKVHAVYDDDAFYALDVSEDGRFVGIGRYSGAVEIYIAFSLQRLYRCDRAHSNFVTRVAFLRCCNETRRLAGNYETSLISTSVDNNVVAHHIPYPATIGVPMLVILFAATLYFTYFLIVFLGL